MAVSAVRPSASGSARRAAGRTRRPALWTYGYLAPAGVLLAAFHVYPLGYGVYVSLHRWGLTRQAFIGLANYAAVLHDPEFWRSLVVTVYYVAGTVPAELVLGFTAAALLSGAIRGRAVYRLVYFLPYVTSMVALGLVWSWIFNANFGLLNGLLRLVHLPPQRWLLEPRAALAVFAPWTAAGGGAAGTGLGLGPSLALVCVTAATVWYYAGFHTVVYLASLTAIPAEVHEAARLDGAAGWRLLRHVTLPLVSPTTYFLAIIATIGAFQSVSLVYTLTGGGAAGGAAEAGGPLGTTRVVTLYVFNAFYSEFRVGYATAAAFVLFALLLGLTLVQMRLGRGRVHYLGAEPPA